MAYNAASDACGPVPGRRRAPDYCPSRLDDGKDGVEIVEKIEQLNRFPGIAAYRRVAAVNGIRHCALFQDHGLEHRTRHGHCGIGFCIAFPDHSRECSM